MDDLRPAEYAFTFTVPVGEWDAKHVTKIAQSLEDAYAAILADYGYGELSCVNPV